METEIRQDDALELVPDNIPPDAILRQRIFTEQSAALQAKNIHNYTEAKLSAAAAQTDSQTMYNRFMKFNNVRGDVKRFGTNEQNNTHIVMQRYVESSDALYKAIVSHELAHMLKLEAYLYRLIVVLYTHVVRSRAYRWMGRISMKTTRCHTMLLGATRVEPDDTDSFDEITEARV